MALENCLGFFSVLFSAPALPGRITDVPCLRSLALSILGLRFTMALFKMNWEGQTQLSNTTGSSKQRMERRFINELQDGEVIDQIFRASEKQLRTNRNGNLYLQLRLSDRTGSLTAMLWNARQNQFDSFANGDFLRVKGTAQLYNGGMQILCKEIEPGDERGIQMADFETLSLIDIEKMLVRIAELLRSMENADLRNLADCFWLNERFLEGFRQAPAGVKNHHAFQGGLLQHVLSLMELVDKVTPLYPMIDRDLLLMGAFLHDIGKIHELTYQPDLGYSDEGQLLGHLVLGIRLLDEMIVATERQSGEPFPADLALHLRHLILSHHGEYDFGSPKLPMTVEAIALHLLDNLDSKIYSFQQLIDDDANKSSHWTPYQPALNRKIYKGFRRDSAIGE
jgi:3'-5' exoribonuclease